MQEHDAFPEGGQEQMEGTSPSTNPLHDEHVKHVAMLVTALVVLLSLAGFLWFYSIDTGDQNMVLQPEPQVTPTEEPLELCIFASDEEALYEAIAQVDLEICTCMQDGTLKEKCNRVVTDATLFESAITQLDDSLCDEISDESHKVSCRQVVASSVEHFEAENPQYLAAMYASSHNEKSIQEFESLLESDPENVEYLIGLALALANKGLNEQEQGRSQTPYVEEALGVVERLKNVAPEDSETYRVEGYVHEVKPDFTLALEAYEKSIELNTQNALAYIGRGHVFNMLGILEDAYADYKKASELDTEKSIPQIYANLCRLGSSREDLKDEAKENCIITTDFEEIDPSTRSVAHQVLASLYSENREYSKAEAELLQALSLTPRDANVYVTYASLEIAQSNYPVAQEYAQKAIDISPMKTTAYLALAHALFSQGKFEEAIASAQKGLGVIEEDVSLLPPDKPQVQKDLYFTLANIYYNTGDKENEMKYKDLGEQVYQFEPEVDN